MDFGALGTALVMGIAAIGSAIGIGIAGQSSIGAWKKCYMVNKAAPFILTVFAGAPLTQTIYGFLLNPKIHFSTGEESSGSGTDSTQGLRPQHRRERNPERPPSNSHGDWPFLRPPERVPEVPIVSRE